MANAAAEAKDIAMHADAIRAAELRRRAQSAVLSISRLHHRSDAVVRGEMFKALFRGTHTGGLSPRDAASPK